jgi:catechol 2,3-dioxygenase-like lactoylglutathione lyase family enzyme
MLKTDHVVFPVWEAKASLAFYRDVMGFALVDTHSGDNWGGYPWLMMFFSTGDMREIVLVNLRGAKKRRADGLARDVRHFAFSESSVSKIDAWRRKLKKANVDFWEETHGKRCSLYFEDPNGIILEVTAPPSKPAKRTNRIAVAKAMRWINTTS